jgi:N-acetylglucosaminyldiphosphoundecaprenol N-acetyl-beta-D-mannosaminyltransferase
MSDKETRTGYVTGAADVLDEFSRDVYCVLGIPIDVVVMEASLNRIEAAANAKMPFLISTPNLNFLLRTQSDATFRESILQSDLCPADGMPVVWLGRLLGVPIKDRIAGSDIFEALKSRHRSPKPLKVFFFGGAEGVATAACRSLNAQSAGLYCVGSHYPGFGDVDGISGNDIINEINSSGADFLVVSLGAAKGQSWLLHNHNRLLPPIRAHLGAVINFQAAIVKRAPFVLRSFGLEWLWRIKEEPYLWRRYWQDGTALLHLLFRRVLPLSIRFWWLRVKRGRNGQDLVINHAQKCNCITLSFAGFAVAGHGQEIISSFRSAMATDKTIIIDLSATRAIDSRFLGLLLMLRKELKRSGKKLVLAGLSPQLQSVLHLSGCDFLLDVA